MKVSELKLGQQIIINGHKYSYQGVQKIRKSGYTIQQIVFKGVDINFDKYFDITLGSKELSVNGKNIEWK